MLTDSSSSSSSGGGGGGGGVVQTPSELIFNSPDFAMVAELLNPDVGIPSNKETYYHDEYWTAAGNELALFAGSHCPTFPCLCSLCRFALPD
jgi:hypothetical protein